MYSHEVVIHPMEHRIHMNKGASSPYHEELWSLHESLAHLGDLVVLRRWCPKATPYQHRSSKRRGREEQVPERIGSSTGQTGLTTDPNRSTDPQTGPGTDTIGRASVPTTDLQENDYRSVSVVCPVPTGLTTDTAGCGAGPTDPTTGSVKSARNDL